MGLSVGGHQWCLRSNDRFCDLTMDFGSRDVDTVLSVISLGLRTGDKGVYSNWRNVKRKKGEMADGYPATMGKCAVVKSHDAKSTMAKSVMAIPVSSLDGEGYPSTAQ